MKTDANYIIDRLNELRKIKDITLTELADRCVISRPYLSKVFNHTCEPKVSTIIRIANAIDAKIYIYC